MSEILISAREIEKFFIKGKARINVLYGLNLDIKKGDLAAIIGASGVGKSTLLHILGTLDKPNSGKIFFEDKDVTDYSENKLSSFRLKNIGFVFQFHHLLNELTAFENAAVPLMLGGRLKKEEKELVE